MDEDIKREWEEKLRASFGDTSQLLKFMTETMDNFAYRYISTERTPAPKTRALSAHALQVASLEDSMVNALKITHVPSKEGIKDLARRVPKSEKPTVQYSLNCELHEFATDEGRISISARVNWNFPDHAPSKDKQSEVVKVFIWDDLQVYRKGLPLALQEVCELFL